jgi:hypothetical protein
MQFRVKGDSRACIAFAIGIQTREVIILNQILDDDNRVVRPEGFKTIEKYLNNDYLTINMGQILSCRGNLVDNPLDADIIFDDSFTIEIECVDDEFVSNTLLLTCVFISLYIKLLVNFYEYLYPLYKEI